MFVFDPNALVLLPKIKGSGEYSATYSQLFLTFQFNCLILILPLAAPGRTITGEQQLDHTRPILLAHVDFR